MLDHPLNAASISSHAQSLAVKITKSRKAHWQNSITYADTTTRSSSFRYHSRGADCSWFRSAQIYLGRCLLDQSTSRYIFGSPLHAIKFLHERSTAIYGRRRSNKLRYQCSRRLHCVSGLFAQVTQRVLARSLPSSRCPFTHSKKWSSWHASLQFFKSSTPEVKTCSRHRH